MSLRYTLLGMFCLAVYLIRLALGSYDDGTMVIMATVLFMGSDILRTLGK